MINFETIVYGIISSNLSNTYLDIENKNLFNTKFILKSLNLTKKEFNQFLKQKIGSISGIDVKFKDQAELQLNLSCLVVLDILLKGLSLTLDSEIAPQKTARNKLLEDKGIFELIETLYTATLMKNYN